MSWQPALGGTLLIPSGKTRHLFVILNQPGEISGYSGQQAVLVSLSSIKEGVPYDASCCVAVGEHPFVTRASFVEYRHARINACSHLVDCVVKKVFVPDADCAAELLERIRAGFQASPRMGRALKFDALKLL